MSPSYSMLQMHNYHNNIAINGIFKRQFIIFLHAKTICILKTRCVGNVYIALTEEERQYQLDSNQISTIDDTRNFDFSKKQGYSLCCFCDFRKFWKVPRQTNAYVSNKWPVKLPCAYLNTQGSSPSDTPLKRIDDS
ncbi:hypothetical protein T01_10734 [Trichinella spiralis]|uniref:Uncharacterized protein n=1 Tax=Trichinella spiralis TaxID=6334 RepID=A0A0V1BNF9_TRISP|nr:hypothetical protein T01_10734 [Trichinella spiralis]